MGFAAFIKAATVAVHISNPAQLSDRNPADCLARNVWFEARGSSFADKIAVAQVVMNRVRDRSFPNDICSVVYQRAQFSWTLDRKKHRVRITNVIEQQAWDDTVLATKLAIEGSMPDYTEGATHYHAHYVRPNWADKMTTQRHYGAHIYYKNVKPASAAGW